MKIQMKKLASALIGVALATSATTALGLINIDQNNTTKIFTVASVFFLPATLIASIYGMNFKFMPELEWRYGYLLAIVLMLAVSGTTYLFFKRKHWL